MSADILSLCVDLSYVTTSLQSPSLDLLNKMVTSLAQNKTLKRLELRSDGLTQYNDAKLFTQHLVLGAAGSTTLTGVCIGFSPWWRDCHIQSESVFSSRILWHFLAFIHCYSVLTMCIHVSCGSLPIQWSDIFVSINCSQTRINDVTKIMIYSP